MLLKEIIKAFELLDDPQVSGSLLPILALVVGAAATSEQVIPGIGRGVLSACCSGWSLEGVTDPKGSERRWYIRRYES